MTEAEMQAAVDAANKTAADAQAALAAAQAANADAVAAATKRASDINALCHLAGQPASKANEYIASTKNLDEIKAELTALKAAGGGSETDPRYQPKPGKTDAGAAVDWGAVHAKIAKERGIGRTAA